MVRSRDWQGFALRSHVLGTRQNLVQNINKGCAFAITILMCGKRDRVDWVDAVMAKGFLGGRESPTFYHVEG